MQKKGQFLIGGVIAAIVGIIMISLIWGMQTTASQTEDVTNESLTSLIVNISESLANDDVVTGSVTLLNTTTNTTIDPTNYTVSYRAGTITLLDTDHNNTDAYATYTYEPVGYIDSPIARLVLGFIAALLGVALIIWLMKGKE